MKNIKGITLIEVVITIIILLIITSFALFYSLEVTKESRLTKLYNEINVVKDAINEAMVLIEVNPGIYNEEYFFGPNVDINDYDIGVIGAYRKVLSYRYK